MENKTKNNQLRAEGNSHTGNKRQIYLWDENKVFYDSVKNKSRLINLLLKKYREENKEG